MSARQLGDLGYRLILYPVSALRIALKAVEDFFENLNRNGTQEDDVSKMLTRAQLYDLLGYTCYDRRDREYFGR